MITDECVRLQYEFDFAVDVFSGDIKDIVFKRFYNIAAVSYTHLTLPTKRIV